MDNNQINVIVRYALVNAIGGKTSMQVNAPAGTYTVDLYIRRATGPLACSLVVDGFYSDSFMLRSR